MTTDEVTFIKQNAPQCLRAHHQWLVWRTEEVKDRPTKVPYDAKTGRKASSTDPSTWTTFEQAVECYARGRPGETAPGREGHPRNVHAPPGAEGGMP